MKNLDTQSRPTTFEAGKSGNKGGRPKGSKNKFSKIREDWLAAYRAGGGIKLWKKLAKDDLALFMKIGASMLPKDLDIDLRGELKVSATVVFVGNRPVGKQHSGTG